MENATKALLIAAGVLIVILLISISMAILNFTENGSNEAQEVGDAISSATTDAAQQIIFGDKYKPGLITFKIGETTCYAEKDMTWDEWMSDVEYNTINVYSSNMYDGNYLAIDTNSGYYHLALDGKKIRVNGGPTAGVEIEINYKDPAPTI